MSKEKLSEEEIQKTLDGIKTGDTKIEFAPQDETETLRPYIMRVLKAVGHPEAWVSDLSTINDFSPINEEKYKGFIAKVSVKLGFTISGKDYVVRLAERLQEQDSHRKGKVT